MAGKKQHFIPRFLLRGFAHASSEKVWVYKKNTKPFLTNISNIGAERFFYTHNNDDVDDLITHFENKFSDLVNSLRSSGLTKDVCVNDIAELIAHFEVRSKHLRQNFIESGHQVLNRILDFAENKELLGEYLLREFSNDPSLLRYSFSKELTRLGLPLTLLDLLMEIAGPLIPSVIPQITSEFSRFTAQYRPTIPQTLNEVAKESHIESLRKNIAPEMRVKRYQTLTYNVFRVFGAQLPLGDSIVLFRVLGPRPFKPFLDKDDDLLYVLLPLSSEILLVGANSSSTFNEDTFLVKEDIYKAIVRCSHEFFVASALSEQNKLFKNEIGNNSYLISESDIENMQPWLEQQN